MFISKSITLWRMSSIAFVAILVIELTGSCGIPLDDASGRVPRVGQYREYSTDDPAFDYLIYYFDGTRQISHINVATKGIKTIRKRGFGSAKKMMLVVFCDLTTTSKTPATIYPFGLYLKSDVIRSPAIPVTDLTTEPLIIHPINWDHRINEWVYMTNNVAQSGPEIITNANYVPSTNVLDRGWFFELDDLTNRTEVCSKFGVPQYYVREYGTYSEIYPVDDKLRKQTGTVRIWYDGDHVTKTGCYMENR